MLKIGAIIDDLMARSHCDNLPVQCDKFIPSCYHVLNELCLFSGVTVWKMFNFCSKTM